MKLTAKQIEEVRFSVDMKGYSTKEVDDFLDKIADDYKGLEKKNNCDILIYSKFKGELTPKSVVFEGTIDKWKAIENKGVFEEIPCIICSDGCFVQKL